MNEVMNLRVIVHINIIHFYVMVNHGLSSDGQAVSAYWVVSGVLGVHDLVRIHSHYSICSHLCVCAEGIK